MASGTVQFGRSASLLLTNGTTDAVQLSQISPNTAEGLRFKWEIEANDIETPNTARIRVYNLSDQTAKLVINEYNGVILNAGYAGNVGQIFQGTIKQFRRGKEKNTDSFLDIFAADGDIAYNFGLVNVSLPAGNRPEHQVAQSVKSFQAATNPSQPVSLDINAIAYLTQSKTPNINPRGKVMFGLARNFMRDVADTQNVRWSIQNGVVTIIPLTGYLPGTAAVINSLTGMLGSPEATEEGVIVECLLNPLIKVGTAIQLNNGDITATQIKEQFFPGYTNTNFVAAVPSTAGDGYYRVLVVEHKGDTREVDWVSRLTCLLVDNYQGAGGAATNAVAPYGIPLN